MTKPYETEAHGLWTLLCEGPLYDVSPPSTADWECEELIRRELERVAAPSSRAPEDAATPTMEGNLRMVAEAFARTAEAAVSAFENLGKGGMEVPFHGDFANAQPSVISRLRWWAREFRKALAARERTEGEATGAARDDGATKGEG